MTYHPEGVTPWRPHTGDGTDRAIVAAAADWLETTLAQLERHAELCNRMRAGETLWGDEAKEAWELHNIADAIKTFVHPDERDP